MHWAESEKKWSKYQGNNAAACQGHFDDLYRLHGQGFSAEVYRTGRDFFLCVVSLRPTIP